jgi:hypothetical protein
VALDALISSSTVRGELARSARHCQPQLQGFPQHEGQEVHKVHFVVAAPGRDFDDFTVHIYAPLASKSGK